MDLGIFGGIVFSAIGVIGLISGYVTGRSARTLAKTPGVGCAQVPSMATADGASCKVGGVAVPGRSRLTAPWTGQPCVWYRTKVVRYQMITDANNRTREVERVLESHASTEAFGIQDSTGSVWISPDGAEVTNMFRSLHESERPRQVDPRWAESMREAHEEFKSGNRISGAAKMAAGAFQAAVPPGGSGRDLYYVEHIVPEGGPLWVRGGAHRDDQGNVWMGRPDDGPYIISSKNEEKGESDNKLVGTMFLVGGVAFLGIGLLILLASLLF